tara:strand:+ start:513 stop:776 length:264 start_codon:yes stop_codon:yes gene_type:complete
MRYFRIIAKSFLTKREIKEGRIMPLKKAKKFIERRRKQGYRIKEEPHDGANVFPRITTLKLKTNNPNEFKFVKVEKRIWDISEKKVK